MADTDPNVKALNDYRLQWAQRAIASGQVNPRFFPTYAAIMNVPLPAVPMTEQQFNDAANNLANAIKVWYTNARYSGNLAILSQEIDRTKPAFKSNTPVAAAAAAPTPTPAPAPGPSPQTSAIADRFFKSIGGAPATVDFVGEFANFKSLSDADVIDITNLIKTSTSTANFNSVADKLKVEGDKIKTEIQSRRTKAEAINQQFVDDKLAAGPVSKSKVMVLQDYILAGFTVAFLFFAVVVIFYFTKYSEKPLRSFVTLTTLMVVVAAILYTWTSYLA
jgi:hypothetical protein